MIRAQKLLSCTFIFSFICLSFLHLTEADAGGYSARLKCRLMNKVNAFRQQNGLSCMRRDTDLQRAAQQYANWFANNITAKNPSNFGHESDGRTPTARALAAGYKPRRQTVKKIVTKHRRADGSVVTKTVRKIRNYKFVGENILYFQGRDICTPGQFLTASLVGWKNSPVHRKNMLIRSWSATGVGVARNRKTKRCFGVQLFGTGRPGKASCQVQCK
ncbi:MAG: CAP domain-containing protein [Methyloligellaceae bacterium]